MGFNRGKTQKMKRLLLPLLASLAIPTAVISGDLGVADISPERTEGIISDVNIFSSKTPKGFKIDSVNCGMDFHPDNHNLKIQNLLKEDQKKTDLGLDFEMRKDCKVEFKNGKLIVNNSTGITASQIQNFYVIAVDPNGFRRRIEIIYIDSNKKFVRAGISFDGIPTRVPKFEQFMKRFIRFLNEG